MKWDEKKPLNFDHFSAISLPKWNQLDSIKAILLKRLTKIEHCEHKLQPVFCFPFQIQAYENFAALFFTIVINNFENLILFFLLLEINKNPPRNFFLIMETKKNKGVGCKLFFWWFKKEKKIVSYIRWFYDIILCFVGCIEILNFVGRGRVPYEFERKKNNINRFWSNFIKNLKKLGFPRAIG